MAEQARRFARVEGIGFVHFNERDVVRHPLVQRIVRAYETYSAQTLQQQSLTFDTTDSGEKR